ncbi:MAG: TIGR01841 family phasin [Alphaproteobacteria bacterium]|nr:TIGR01841 family phasin [Alphaproteobacteria bacterium]
MAYQNPFAEMMKTFSDFKAPTLGSLPTVDVNQLMASGRRNAETCSAVGQTLAESVQTITRRQADLARAQVEKLLKTTKDMLVNGSPEINTTKQVELAKTMFESSLNNLREVSELVAKSGFEMFDKVNRRASESIEELTGAATATTPSAKRKAA